MKNIINLRISILSLIALLHFSNVNSQNVSQGVSVDLSATIGVYYKSSDEVLLQIPV